MLKAACFALSIGALIYGFGGKAQAGWNDAASGLSLSASSLVISVKKHKNNDDDDSDHDGKNHKSSNKGKHQKHDDKQEADEHSTQGGSGGKSGSSSGGIKPIDDVPAGTLLLPYFECDLSKNEPCKH